MSDIEINGPTSNAIADSGNNRLQTNTTAQQTASAVQNNPSRDTLSLTGQAERLQQLARDIASQPEVDTQRVERVQRSLATGEFNIDSDRVASKLLGFENSLSQAGSG